MPTLLQTPKLWLSILLIVGLLLRPDPAAAQSNGGVSPAEESVQANMYLPIAMAEVSPSHPNANPLSVTVTADTSRAVTQTIPIEGGTLTVTATNGTRYTLVIPADALLSDEEIVMTPLASMADVPLSGGQVIGVQLAPNGLRLMQPATLTIEGAPAFDPTLQVVGFGYQERGDEFHLRPVLTNGSSYTVKLFHFSGYGVAAGTQQEIQAQAADHAPTAPDDAMAQGAAADPDADGLPQLIKWYETALVHDLTEGRGGDMSSLERATFYFPIWVEFAKQDGLEEELAEYIAEGWKHLFIGLGNAIDFGYAACKEGDASQVVKLIRWVRITRSMPAAPRREWISDNWLNNTAKQKALGCATFEMDFDSTLAQDVPNVPWVGQSHDSHLRAENIRVQFDLNGKLVTPSQAPLTYQSFNLAGSMPGCASSTSTTGGTFNLTHGRINLNYNWGETPKFNFKFDPGHPEEFITHTCPKGVQLHFEPKFWNTGFWLIHWDELRMEEMFFEFTQWRYVGKSLYAELIIERPATEKSQYFSGTTWMVLAHAPE